MADKISSVKGMNDILPPESARWEWFEGHVRAVMASDKLARSDSSTPTSGDGERHTSAG